MFIENDNGKLDIEQAEYDIRIKKLKYYIKKYINKYDFVENIKIKYLYYDK